MKTCIYIYIYIYICIYTYIYIYKLFLTLLLQYNTARYLPDFLNSSHSGLINYDVLMV